MTFDQRTHEVRNQQASQLVNKIGALLSLHKSGVPIPPAQQLSPGSMDLATQLLQPGLRHSIDATTRTSLRAALTEYENRFHGTGAA